MWRDFRCRLGYFEPRLQDDHTLIFHELPSYWVVAALFPADLGQLEDVESARLRFVSECKKLSKGDELDEHIPWVELKALYLEPLEELKRLAGPNDG